MVIRNNNGFTLIEVLVSIVLVAILLLGLLQGLIISQDLKFRNLLRDEAIKIANEYIEKYRNTKLSNIPSSETKTIIRKISNKNISYTLNMNSIDKFGGKLKELSIKITWNYKGKNYSYTLLTLIGDE